MKKSLILLGAFTLLLAIPSFAQEQEKTIEKAKSEIVPEESAVKNTKYAAKIVEEGKPEVNFEYRLEIQETEPAGVNRLNVTEPKREEENK